MWRSRGWTTDLSEDVLKICNDITIERVERFWSVNCYDPDAPHWIAIEKNSIRQCCAGCSKPATLNASIPSQH